MLDIQLAIGSAGLSTLLIAFALNSIGILKHSSPFHSIINAIGALLLAHYAIAISSTIFTVLNLIWGFVGIVRLISILKQQHI